jgi:trk system potassium uptake protein TrkH
MRTVIFLLGFACTLFFASLAVPILVGFAHGEDGPALQLAVMASTGAFIAILSMAASLGYRHVVTPTRLILSMVFVWLALSIIGTFPFLLVSGLSFERALFESVSGLTTTGATTLSTRELLPQSILFWRLQLEWIGGFLTLASLFLVLSPLAIGGLPRRATAWEWYMDQKAERDAGFEHLKRYMPLLATYLAASVIVFFLFVASGTDSLGAAHLTMTSVATGGFNPYDGDLGGRFGVSTMAIMAGVLTISATSLFWQRYDLFSPMRVIRENREAWWVMLLVAAITSLYLLAFRNLGAFSGGSDLAFVLVDSFFSAASVIATSGHEVRPGIIALLPEVLVFSAAFVGAAVFSTASGLKMHRLGAMLIQSFRELNLLIYPSSVIPTRIANVEYNERTIIETWPVMLLLLAVLALAVFGLAGGPGTFEASILSGLALLLNAGPLYEAYIPVAATPDMWPEYRDFNSVERLLACVVMLLGRLEFVAVFAILNLRYWLSR